MKTKYWKNRWNTIAYEIRFIFVISFSLIITIEFILAWFDAPNEACYKFGQFILKLSYSFTSASIFYFLVQHMPKERKKIKLHKLISNKIYNVETQITFLTRNLLNIKESIVLEELSLISCSNLLAKKSNAEEIMIDDTLTRGTFSNDEYVRLAVINIFNFSNEVLEFNEYVDTKVIHIISKIISTCEIIMRVKIYRHSNNLRKYDYDIFNLIQDNLALRKAVQSYSKNYYTESNELNQTFHKIKEGEEFEGDDIIYEKNDSK